MDSANDSGDYIKTQNITPTPVKLVIMDLMRLTQIIQVMYDL